MIRFLEPILESIRYKIAKTAGEEVTENTISVRF